MDLNLDLNINLDLALSNPDYQQLPQETSPKTTNTNDIPESSNSREKANNPQSQETPENPIMPENPEIPNLLANLENLENPNPQPQPNQINYLGLALHLYVDPFEITKILTRSDITHGFNIRSMWWALIFPYLHPSLVSSLVIHKSVPITIRDLDTSTNHEVLLRSWSTYDRYALTGGWFEQFIDRRLLQLGDEVGFIWDRYYQRFLFTVLRRKDAR